MTQVHILVQALQHQRYFPSFHSTLYRLCGWTNDRFDVLITELQSTEAVAIVSLCSWASFRSFGSSTVVQVVGN